MTIAALLQPPGEADHKYSRGVLAVRTGSTRYPGAAVLSIEAAWRTGLGMVRFAAPSEAVAHLVLQRRPETVTEDGHADAWLIGSGMALTPAMPHKREAILRALADPMPVVLDAGAIAVLEPGKPPTAPTMITPHEGEFVRLWQSIAPREPVLRTVADRRRAARTVAERFGVAVLLKGSVTVIAEPSGNTAEAGPATPWLATAGTGDVLGGILGALVATHAADIQRNPGTILDLGRAASLIHDGAARIAAHGSPTESDPATGRPITALDVAEAIPAAVEHLRRN